MGFRHVLFDFRGTLFVDDSEADWILASAASLGLELPAPRIAALVQSLAEAELDEGVIAARANADCSRELNRAAALLQFRIAGFDDDLALACWERDGNFDATRPYPDTLHVLHDLKTRGVGIAVVSDIHYDLRPLFDHYGLLQFVDSFSLSFELGCQKPDRRMFEVALEALGAAPNECLMVGDRASRDGGAVAAGITTLLLPAVEPGDPRGLGHVLRLVD